MAATTISVSRIIELGIPVAWQEAVEVAHAAYKLGGDSSGGITPRGCFLTAAGKVELHHVPAGPDNPTLSSPQLLALLLEGQAAPPELLALLAAPGAAFTTRPAADGLSSFPSEQSTTAPGAPTLDWFVRANPEVEIARLAGRALAADGERAKLEHLRSGARSQPTEKQPPPDVGAARSRVGRRIALATVAVVGVAGAAIWMSTGSGRVWLEKAAATWPSPGDSAPAAVDDAAAATGATERVPAAPKAVVGSASATTGGATPRGSGSAPPVRATRGASVAGEAPGDAGRAAAADLQPAGIAANEAPLAGMSYTAPEADVVLSARVYSVNDRGVEPPVMRRPQLPSAPKPDSEATSSYVEVIVDERGQVAQVRLRSNDPSLNDRMLVSAAKAWQFEPAVKDGRPVPYRMQIPVTR